MNNDEQVQSDYRIGPGMASLIMILVALCMAALAILALASAQADKTLSERHSATTVAYYEAEARLQRQIAAVDAALYGARADANGDVDAYIQSVLELGADAGASAEKTEESAEGAIEKVAQGGDGGLEIHLAIPYGEQLFLRAALAVPRSLAGERYTIRSHVVQDESDWQPETEFDLFMPYTDFQ